ncbi:MAG TPA: carboxypeptidase-like regulatory domain-containing protein [Caulifigura sp.]|jgi:hypothetical protein|nr:carboxypeptidase-like regulatory domain-containing protein [Caulifigura sp.]
MSASVVAHVLGRPPALSWFDHVNSFQSDGLFDPPPPASPAETIDLVIPDAGGTLVVQVLKDGMPLAGVHVGVRLEGADPFDHWGLDATTEEHRELYGICRPTAQANQDGIVRVGALLPGLYSILALEGRREDVLGGDRLQSWIFPDQTPYGFAEHVAVRTGDVTERQISFFDRQSVVAFDVRRDGKPWSDVEELAVRGTLVLGGSSVHGFRPPGVRADVYRFATIGLADVSVTKYSRTSKWPRTYPFNSADVVLALSPRLSNTGPITMTAQQNRGGIVRVRILDREGRPVAGTARFTGIREGSLSCDSGTQPVPADGAVIEGFEPATGFVQGTIDGRTRLVLMERMDRMPSREELIGRWEVMPQPAPAENNRECEVTLCEEIVGYVRGRIKVAAGLSVSDYRVLIGSSSDRQGTGVYTDAGSGEFVAGPYRSGEVDLAVYRRSGSTPLLRKGITVRAGAVSDLEFEMGSDTEWLDPSRRVLKAQVVHADGKTPARLAAVACYSPRDSRVQTIGLTDSNGQMRIRWGWGSDRAESSRLPGTPEKAVAIAWAPGLVGAAVVPLPERLGQPLMITLPPPLAVRGQVLIEGEGARITNGTLTVRAQHQGLGRLDDLLSVETTAGSDGLFELAGLTPGTYRVQAALDGIWVSESEVLISTEQPDPPIQLTIRPPGGPVVVRVTGRDPAKTPDLVVKRPEGPLSERLWPRSLTADGAGVIRVPALEAGTHVLRLGDRDTIVTVPSLVESKGKPVEAEIVLGDWAG